jgi:hypothetical protein
MDLRSCPCSLCRGRRTRSESAGSRRPFALLELGRAPPCRSASYALPTSARLTAPLDAILGRWRSGRRVLSPLVRLCRSAFLRCMTPSPSASDASALLRSWSSPPPTPVPMRISSVSPNVVLLNMVHASCQAWFSPALMLTQPFENHSQQPLDNRPNAVPGLGPGLTLSMSHY